MKRLLVLILAAAPLFSADPTLNEVAWMAGHWSGQSGEVQMEEVWLAPSGGLMTGMHRDVKGERTLFFEFLRIEATKDGIVYFAQPKGNPPTPFKLVEVSETRAVFANPEHDYPQRIIYSLRDGQLCARTEGEGHAAEEWCWSRVMK